MRAVNHKHPSQRYHAVSALGRIHAQSGVVVPALIAALRDPGIDVRRAAILALENFGGDAKPAVPALIELWRQDPDTGVRNIARDALQLLAPEIAAQAGVKFLQ